MRLGVYSLVTPDYDIEDAADLVADLGYSGIEWTMDYPNALWDGHSKWHISTGDLKGTARRAREAAQRAGLATVGLGPRCDCFQGDLVRQALEAAGLVGAGGIRVHAPAYDGSMPCDELLARGREALAGLEEDARRSGVNVWVEIHNGRFSASASATRRLLEGLSPDWIGAILDPGNMVREGMENWRMAIEALGPYVQHVHVKDCGWFRGGDGTWSTRSMALADGMVDWPQVIEGLRSIGYQGFLNMEDFRTGYASVSPELPTREMLRQDIEYLGSLL
jgi:sugar phosphate isomerase/epimerase